MFRNEVKRILKSEVPAARLGVAALTLMLVTACATPGGVATQPPSASQASTAPSASSAAAGPTCGTAPVELNAYFETGFDLPFKLSEEFTKQYPNVTINLVHKPNLTDAVTAAAGAGQGPDIVAWVDDQIGKWVKLEAIKPMDAYVSRDYMTSQFTSAAVDSFTPSSALTGPALTIRFSAIVPSPRC